MDFVHPRYETVVGFQLLRSGTARRSPQSQAPELDSRVTKQATSSGFSGEPRPQNLGAGAFFFFRIPCFFGDAFGAFRLFS